MSYATDTNLYQLGINTTALSGVAPAAITDMLAACSSMVDDALTVGGIHTAPLTTYPMSVTLNVCKLAQYELMSVEGYAPDEEDEKQIRRRWEDAMKWLEKLEGGFQLSGVVDSNPGDDDDNLTVVDSDNERGWGYGSDPETTTADDF